MSENSLNDNTLLRNNISLFILRVDIFPTIDFDLFSVINKITNNFDRVEKRIVTNFSVILKEGNPEINKTENFDYVLINDNPRNSLTFSKITNSFWFETNQYKNNKTYHDIFSLIIQALSSISIGIESKRIGMRYINDFPCSNKKNISKIFNPTISKTIANLVSKTDISRAIAQEEYNYSTSKLRVQYGIPN